MEERKETYEKTGEKKEVKRYVKYDYYNNGVDSTGVDRTIDGSKVNEIIAEIIGIMAKHNITVYTSEQILQDAISAITKNTVIT